MPTPITHVVEVISSKHDVNGNRDFAVRVYRVSDGASTHGRIDGGASNCTYPVQNLANKYGGDCLEFEKELPIKKFQKLTKGWDLLGCGTSTVMAEIERRLG